MVILENKRKQIVNLGEKLFKQFVVSLKVIFFVDVRNWSRLQLVVCTTEHIQNVEAHIYLQCGTNFITIA